MRTKEQRIGKRKCESCGEVFTFHLAHNPNRRFCLDCKQTKYLEEFIKAAKEEEKNK